MRKLKDSGVEWIGEIPEHWEVSTISKVFSQRNMKVSDFDFSPLSVTKHGIVPQLESAAKSDDHSNRKLVKKGDFVVNSRSDRKMSSGVSEFDGSVSLINLVMIPRGEKLNGKFVGYLLKNYGFAEEFYRWGTGIVADLWSTNWERGKRIQLPIPPISEQQRIAKFLDEKTALIDDIITDTKQTIAELKSYKQSLISEIVTNGINKDVKMVSTEIDWIDEIPEGWEVAKIKNISKLRNEKTSYERGQNFLALEKMVSYKPGYIDLLTEVENGRQQVIKQGDIVFSKLRPYLAKVALADFDGHGTGELLVFNDIKIKRKLFMYKLISEQILQPVRGASYGVKMPRANPDFILSLPISFPISLSEQSKIVNYLDQKMSQIDTLIIEKENLISEYEYYKKSIIYEYVTGKKQVEGYES
ncbi:restriction endonuclease subunit S [Streptococcus mitis]|jgi:type I restriction modification DNA specificity protein|uniref:restriction endonuclease subunit S n=1 Tax=Streptococcus mitis TaxID=28037 RepID=UPI0025E65C28|nr:restriction endonuclease subunit S [uncultured Streptococcus sp.]